MSELKPCPFCAGAAAVTWDDYWWAMCIKCEASVRGMGDDDDAIAEWNRRSPCQDCERRKVLLAQALLHLDYDHHLPYVIPGGDVEADRERVVNEIWAEIGPREGDDDGSR